MGLINRVPTAAQQAASRANGAQSEGPRSVRGKRNSSRNSIKPFALDAIFTLEDLDEQPDQLKKLGRALRSALEPRDAFEDMLVNSIALLQWRLGRVHRAEAGVIGWNRRHHSNQRRLSGLHRGGVHHIQDHQMMSTAGYAGLSDSPEKFLMVTSTFRTLRNSVAQELLDKTDTDWIQIIYGKMQGLSGARLINNLKRLLEFPAKGDPEKRAVCKQELLDLLDQEIDNWTQLADIYQEEVLGDAIGRDDAELLPPADELDRIIRYESHLEYQIERKLRQFYARRRESMCRPAEELSAAAQARRPLELFRAAGAGSGGEDQSR